MAPTYPGPCKRDVPRRGSQSHTGTSCSLPLYQKLSDHPSAKKVRKRAYSHQSVSTSNTRLLISILTSFAYASRSPQSFPLATGPRHRMTSLSVNRSMHRSDNTSNSSWTLYSTNISRSSDASTSSLPFSNPATDKSSSDAAIVITDATMSSQATTPDVKSSTFSDNPDGSSASQSSLSSVPSEIGSTPEGLGGQVLDPSRTRSGSPINRHSQPVRKQSTRAPVTDSEGADNHKSPVKRRKITSSEFAPCGASGNARYSGLLYSNKSSFQPIRPTSKYLQKSTFESGQTSTANNDKEEYPESNVRDEIPSYSDLCPANLKFPKDHEDASIETDVIYSFLDKLKNEQCQPRNDVSGISNHLDQVTLDASFQHKTATTSAAASGAERGSNNGSAAASPSEKAGRSNNTGKAAKGQGKFNKGKNRTGGSGGRDRDSPEPNEKAARTTSDQILLKSVRQRQLELKKWFAIIGTQQMEALEIMSSRDLSKLHKKSAAHTKVPEHDELLHSLGSKEDHTRSLINKEHRMRQELAIRTLEAQKQVIESTFLNRVNESRVEHLKGAEGDLMILQGAHKSQVDETRTDNGSEGAANLPLYHELPEPNARIRGYSSTRIDDEKPFKEHLASYDEQAQREVIDDDIVAPVMQFVAKQNAERSAEEERKAREKMNQLATVSESELKRINSYRTPRPPPPNTNPQFNLSRLADCADLMREREREKKFGSVSDTPKAMPPLPNEPLHRLTRPATTSTSFSQHLPNHAPSTRPKSPATRRKKSSISAPTRRATREEEAQSQSSSSTSTPLPNIAPAPPKMPPPPASTQHHYHHMPQHGMLPPPSSTAATPIFSRHSTLAPLIIPKTSSTPPGTPIYGQGYPQSSHVPPPPSPFLPRPSPTSSGFPHQSPAPRPIQSYSTVSHQAPPSPFSSQPPRLQSFEPTLQRSPTEQLPPPPPLPPSQPSQPSQPAQPAQPSTISPNPRFALNSSVSPYVSRHHGQRRGSGQITFTPTQTPSSERFTRPPGPAPQLPGRSVIRPAQLGIVPPSQHSRSGSAPGLASESRTLSAADIARQNAAKNQVQGAGPKGGRRVLLPKSLS